MQSNRIIKHLDNFRASEVLDICKCYDALFFDMDGTILNSEPIHWEAIQQLTNHQSEYSMLDLFGKSDKEVFPLLEKHLNMSYEEFLAQKNEILLKTIPHINLEKIFYAEIGELLANLYKQGKKLALVTASEDVVTEALLHKCKVYDLFDIVIHRQNVSETKPSPIPYQEAINMLKIDANKALVFEDSPTGIESATKANLDIVKVSWYENF